MKELKEGLQKILNEVRDKCFLKAVYEGSPFMDITKRLENCLIFYINSSSPEGMGQQTHNIWEQTWRTEVVVHCTSPEGFKILQYLHSLCCLSLPNCLGCSTINNIKQEDTYDLFVATYSFCHEVSSDLFGN